MTPQEILQDFQNKIDAIDRRTSTFTERVAWRKEVYGESVARIEALIQERLAPVQAENERLRLALERRQASEHANS